MVYSILKFHCPHLLIFCVQSVKACRSWPLLSNATTLPTQLEGTGSKQQTSLDTRDAENQEHEITSSPGSTENSDKGKRNQFVFK